MSTSAGNGRGQVELSAHDLKLLAQAGGHPSDLRAHVTGTHLTELVVEPDTPTFIIRLEDGIGWWEDDRDAVRSDRHGTPLIGPIDVEQIEHSWSMAPMPPDLHDHYVRTLERWAANTTPLRYLCLPTVAFLHDGTVALPMSATPPPPLSTAT